MKIELTDREHWLSVINQRLQWIYDERQQSDKEFLVIWEKRKWWQIWKSEMPEYGEEYCSWNTGHLHYPCQDYWVIEQTLEKLRNAMLTPHTGAIYVDSDEFRALGGASDLNNWLIAQQN